MRRDELASNDERCAREIEMVVEVGTVPVDSSGTKYPTTVPKHTTTGASSKSEVLRGVLVRRGYDTLRYQDVVLEVPLFVSK